MLKCKKLLVFFKEYPVFLISFFSLFFLFGTLKYICLFLKGLGVTRQELSARLAARAPLASRAATPVTHHHGEVKEVGGSTTEMGPPPNARAVCRSFYTLSGRQR